MFPFASTERCVNQDIIDRAVGEACIANAPCPRLDSNIGQSFYKPMKKLGLFLPLITLALVSCLSTRHKSIYPLPGGYSYSVPPSLDDGLATGSIIGDSFRRRSNEKTECVFRQTQAGCLRRDT